MIETRDEELMQSYLNEIFKTLRADINADEYYFVLFLLVLQKEGILNESVGNNEQSIIHDLRVRIEESESKNAFIYKSIWDLFKPKLTRLHPLSLFKIVSILRALDQHFFEEYLSLIFDNFLYILIKYEGRKTGIGTLPVELSQFLLNLAELPPDAKIYNPFAGIASFGVFTEQSHRYLGQELNYTSCAIGQLRLIAHNLEANSEFLSGDSMQNWNPRKIHDDQTMNFFSTNAGDEKFDLIISNPPFTHRLPYPIKSEFGQIKNYEQFVIEKGMHDLTPNGKLIVVISTGFLFRGGSERELRKYLVHRNLLEMVISFPAGLLQNSGIPIAVLVIGTGEGGMDAVKFINAATSVENTTFREKRINVNSLQSLVNDRNSSKYVRLVSADKIIAENYNLNVPRYFKKEVSGLSIKQLSVGTASIQQNFGETHGKLIRTRDLKSDKLDYSLTKAGCPKNIRLMCTRGITLEKLKTDFFQVFGRTYFYYK
jgi:type I restriction enzyme M protein